MSAGPRTREKLKTPAFGGEVEGRSLARRADGAAGISSVAWGMDGHLVGIARSAHIRYF